VIAGYVLGYSIMVVYLFVASRSRMTLSMQPRLILESLRLSVPIQIALGSILAYQMTIDRLTIVRLLSIEQVGYYAIGQSMINIMGLVPAAVGEAIAPSLIAMMGAGGEAGRHWRRGTYVLALLMTTIAAVLIAIVPGVIRLVFPRYEPGISATQALACAAYFDAVGVGSHYVVISGGKLKSYIVYTAVLAGIAFFAMPIVCRRAGIVGVAVAMVVLTAARTLWTMWTADRLTGASRRDTMLTLLGLIGLGAVGVVAGWVALMTFAVATEAGRYAILSVTLLRAALAFGCVGIVAGLLGRATGYRLREAVDFVKATRMIPIWRSDGE
jgi:O-antigen/teichoic acid export membrane protein